MYPAKRNEVSRTMSSEEMTDRTRWASVPNPDTIRRRELENGGVCLVQERFSSPSVVIRGRLAAGNLSVSREKAGLGGVVADMLMRGTKKRDFSALNEEIEASGASLDFDAGWHSIGFEGRCLAEDLGMLLDILADCLRNPIFPPDQLAKVKGETLTSLEQRTHDTRRMALLRFYEALYEGHPMGVSNLGYVDTISSLTRENLVDFYEQHLRPESLIIAVVGGVGATDAIEIVEAALGDWQKEQTASELALPQPERPETVITREHEIPGKTQADLVLGWMGPSRSSPDYLTVRLANTILGVFGIMGRIGDNVRDKLGLAYYAYSALVPSFMPGPWLTIAGVNPDNVEKAQAAILDEIRRLREEPVPAEELAENKSYLVGSMPLSLESNSGVASVLKSIELYNLGLDYLVKYPGYIKEITPAEIQRVAREYLDLDAYTLSIARPASA